MKPLRIIVSLIYNIYHTICLNISCFFSHIVTAIIFWLSGVKHSTFRTYGVPFIHASMNSHISIGDNFTMGNSIRNNATGVTGRCKIDVRRNAQLVIGNNVGVTLTTIECFNKIIIDDHVKIGFGVHIMDTDFHSINAEIRMSSDNDVKTAPIHIKRNAFIGAHSLILKGVVVGENSIIGAGSVVTKSIPDNCTVIGNPAYIVKKDGVKTNIPL